MTFPVAFPFSKTAAAVNYGGATPDIRINAGANPADYFLLQGTRFVMAPGDDFGLICDPTVQACRNFPPCIRVPPMPPVVQIAIRNTATVSGDRLVLSSADAKIIDTPLQVRSEVEAFDDGAELTYHVYLLAPTPAHPELSGKLIVIPLDPEPMTLLDPNGGSPLAKPRASKPRKPAKAKAKAKAKRPAKARKPAKAKAKKPAKAKAKGKKAARRKPAARAKPRRKRAK
jgi:hypothetical protein